MDKLRNVNVLLCQKRYVNASFLCTVSFLEVASAFKANRVAVVYLLNDCSV